jgi:hypothetical protein
MDERLKKIKSWQVRIGDETSPLGSKEKLNEK